MYQKDNNSIIKHLDFVLLDLLLLEFSFFLLFGIRHGFGNVFKNSSFNLMAGILLIVHLAVVILTQSYQDILRRGYLVELKKVVQQNTWIMLIVFSLMFVAKMQNRYSRSVFIFSWMLSIVLVYGEHLFWKNVTRKRLRTSDGRSHLLLISDAESAEYCLGKLKEKKESIKWMSITGSKQYSRTAWLMCGIVNWCGKNLPQFPVFTGTHPFNFFKHP